MSMDELWELWAMRRPGERWGELEEGDVRSLYAELKA
jgi:hypothetical protein